MMGQDYRAAFQARRRSIEAVIFDLGGVITTGLSEALVEMVEWYGADASPQRLLSQWGPLYLQASLGRTQPEELWHRLRQDVDLGELPAGHEDEEFLSRIGLREESIPQTLAVLKESYVLGLLSNHVGRWARALLERFALLPSFDVVVISSEIGARKPDLLGYERVCQMLKVAPEKAIYVADEEEDLIACQAVGMFPIFVPGEDAGSTVGLLLENVSDLPRLLQVA
jgi:FMN phosphatase YigB (HAD superfamily)